MSKVGTHLDCWESVRCFVIGQLFWSRLASKPQQRDPERPHLAPKDGTKVTEGQ